MAEPETDTSIVTARPVVRHPVESDRPRFVELFCDPRFMVFSDRVMTTGQAEQRFDHLVECCAQVPFAKQPIVARSTGLVLGYTGVDWIGLERRQWLEWGYRLIPEARGLGYATEASEALLRFAGGTYRGEILAITHTDNEASQRVCGKLGFRFWKRGPVNGEERTLYLLRL